MTGWREPEEPPDEATQDTFHGTDTPEWNEVRRRFAELPDEPEEP